LIILLHAEHVAIFYLHQQSTGYNQEQYIFFLMETSFYAVGNSLHGQLGVPGDESNKCEWEKISFFSSLEFRLKALRSGGRHTVMISGLFCSNRPFRHQKQIKVIKSKLPRTLQKEELFFRGEIINMGNLGDPVNETGFPRELMHSRQCT
jgi:hypothetical protein